MVEKSLLLVALKVVRSFLFLTNLDTSARPICYEAMASFLKIEKITSAAHVALIFDRTGRVFKHYPLLFIIKPIKFDDNVVSKVLISVSKKHFKRAVDRNLLRRRIRFAHQHYKEVINGKLASHGKFGIGVVYISNKKASYKIIEAAYNKLINDLD